MTPTAQFDRLLALSSDMLCIASLDGCFRHVSPAFTQALGCSREELLARPLLDFVHPDDRARTEAEIDRLHGGAPAIDFENRFGCRDGSWRRLSWRMTLGAEEHALYASARDITDLRLDDEHSWENATRYYTLFSSIDEGFCVIEVIFDDHDTPVDYRFVEVNPAFEQQTGLRDAVGKRMRELAPHHERHWFEIYGRVALTGEPIRFENRAEQLGRWYDVYTFRFGSPRRRQVAILFNDISERKAAEQRIVELNAELESFSYSVSHDLRAPLRSIDGFSQILLEDNGDRLTASGKDALMRVRRAAGDMADLIDALLSLSRMTREPLRLERVDLSAAAEAIAARLRQSQAGRAVDVAIAPNLSGEGDARLLGAVLENLLGNAWKYSQPREQARIEFGAFERDGETVYFVRDNGAGFDMAYVHKLFGAFQRLHRKEQFPGTGVGLATVQRIVRRHGGRVWAEAAVDQGATFYFTLHAGPQ